jgi:DNA gyrase subunit B
MIRELTTRGLKDTVLHVVAGPKGEPAGVTRAAWTVTGPELLGLLPLLAEAETAVVNLERRGHSLTEFILRARDGHFPEHYVRLAGKEFWFHSADEVKAFVAASEKEMGRTLVLANPLAEQPIASNSTPDNPAETSPVSVPEKTEFYTQEEWHEVRALNRVVGKLRNARFEPGDLVPLPRLAGREPPIRFTIQHGEARHDLVHLLALPTEIRKFGEKGITVTRFKGLGEMDPEELWDTTLDPTERCLLRVTLTDAQKAEQLFRELMGEEVEGRKKFILGKQINDLEDIDYGA